MVYYFFYYLLKFASHFYFKKIRIYDKHHIPVSKPLIICANHGNSFLDAILMAVVFKRKLHFLARADAFNTPFKTWFLSKINMMPIYRIRDGIEGLKNNDAIFLKCQQILANNGAILIFPEGNCVVEKRLRIFKTGFVHLAFNSAAKDVVVLPVTINYSKPYQFYTDVSFWFSRPINVEAVKTETNENYIGFSKKLIADLENKIKEHMLIIPSILQDDLYEQLLEIYRNQLHNNQNFIEKQIFILNLLNQLKENEPQLYEQLASSTTHYFKKLNVISVSDMAIIYQNTIFQKALYPVYLIGKLYNFSPIRLIQAQILKIKEQQFISSVRLVVGLLVYLIYIPISIFVLNVFIANLCLSILLVLGLQLFYYFSFESFTLFEQKYGLSKADKAELETLRNEIIYVLNL